MSFDKEFEIRIRAILGDEYDAFSAALTRAKISALRINPLKKNVDCSNTDAKMQKNDGEEDPSDRVKRILSAEGCEFTSDIPWESAGKVYSEGAPGKHPLHEAGAYYIQEPSAMSPVHYLDPKPGEKILDLCAAPGGKSTQIAGRMMGEGILVTNEIDRKRAQILSLNIERCGVKNALVTNMKPEQLSDVFEGYFDKILVDAPCSGEGMFRKNDEAISNWSPENVELCAKRQSDILKDAVKMLAPGGRLVYSTCTFAPEEDELQAAKLLAWGLKPVSVELYEGMVSGDTDNLKSILEFMKGDPKDISFAKDIPENISIDIKRCTGRLWPHRIDGEGHFFAVFEKDGDISLNAGLYGVNGKVRGIKEDDLSPFKEFADAYLKNIEIVLDTEGKAADLNKDKKADKKSAKNKKSGKGSKAICKLDGCLKGTPFMFGEQLYLAPEGMPGIAGLTVMRPGLHLGTIKNGRFEPSHSLALAIDTDMAVLSYELEETLKTDDTTDTSPAQTPSAASKSMQFIGGMCFRQGDLQNGWYLITSYGYGLGWAKYAGGTLKNHYPKGLRIYT
ncbi:RsmB/NOP family class I SAM-dependent RNA methyltransferase [Butyrivibrio sp. FC2001]|uniref:RsmB/NOP family class I SAM-dependent RNA methyltransferase n=1 Tax=Butyrivibrio sp. FC2001 TaxID=1280671 RepID=UPI0004165D61|nr:RsmF rRNA methyltransferase first C-terminal domain-containing protein [Butyrivibrio sp. FC2001]